MMYWRDYSMFGGYMHQPFFYWGVGFWAIWDLAWKGMALWRAARRKENWWFIALLVFNTIGLLPIAYLLIWGKEDGDQKTVKNMVSKVKMVKKAKKKK